MKGSKLSLSKRKRKQKEKKNKAPLDTKKEHILDEQTIETNESPSKKICVSLKKEASSDGSVSQLTCRDESNANHDEVQRISNYASTDVSTPKKEIVEILSDDEDKDAFDVGSSSGNEQIQTIGEDQGSNQDILAVNEANGNETETKTSFRLTYKNSAYVQNLAEISYDILNDARWRVSGERLFRWQYGDDLCALHSFSYLFIDDDDECMNSTPSKTVSSDNEEKSLDEHDLDYDEEIYARSMNLYARMFHRKGPWFKISDLFIRYYHRDFIRRKQYSQPTRTSPVEAGTQSSENKISFESLQNSLNDCMSDLRRLKEMGLIRSFESEEECGRVVGSFDTKLLTEKEKLMILSKLGGKLPASSNALQSSEDENYILKQMKSQKSITFMKRENNVLPVKIHLNQLLQRDLVLKMKELLSSTEKERTSDQQIVAYVKQISKEIFSEERDFLTCFRLKESPLKSLKRACRLYLNAGDGSGSMRSNGANAYILVSELECSFSQERRKERKLLKGICSLPESPESNQWHKVDFHGLNMRMGLRFFEYSSNYSRIKFSKADVCKHVEIFQDIKQFHAWEACVDTRSIIDYLQEWNSLILYAERKKKRISESSEAPGFRDELSPCVSDEFDVLSSDGRKIFLQRFVGFVNHVSITDIEVAVEKNVQILQDTDDEGNNGSRCKFLTDAERMIACLTIICAEILSHRFKNASTSEMDWILKKPWLRHLYPESALAYMIWDGVDILEKRGQYSLAVSLLDLILLESPNNRNDNNDILCNVAKVLLSRRVRGKAFERLFVDKKHSLDKNKKKTVDELIISLIPRFSKSSCIPFSFLRKQLKRVRKQYSYFQCWNNEMIHLGLKVETNVEGKGTKKASHWEPITDESIANAIQKDQHESGARCSFISNEDNVEDTTRSLNVEELAIEEYSAGRLPLCKDDEVHYPIKGGWKGWHCEGVHVRILFRILLQERILSKKTKEHNSIFLNRFQSAPLDLHVGSSLFCSGDSVEENRSFYHNRKEEIESFFRQLETLSPQEISDLLHVLICNRVKKAASSAINIIDPSLLRDFEQLRTLCLIAAGCGGILLAKMFRALCYCYRHYAAGKVNVHHF